MVERRPGFFAYLNLGGQMDLDHETTTPLFRRRVFTDRAAKPSGARLSTPGLRRRSDGPSDTMVEQSSVGAENSDPKTKSHRIRNLAIVAAVLVLLLAVGVLFFGSGIGGTVANSSHSSVVLLQGSISVNGSSYGSVRFDVPNIASNVIVSGTFTASGAPGNDIRVYILTYSDYLNWLNGEQVNPLYDSGQVTSQSISVALPSSDNPLLAGTPYVLVFDNTFSTVGKMVAGQITMTYDG